MTEQRVLASRGTAELTVHAPCRPLWSEQAPADWVTATIGSPCGSLKRYRPRKLSVRCARNRPLRTDARRGAAGRCATSRCAPASSGTMGALGCRMRRDRSQRNRVRARSPGNIAMPGFTAPKLALGAQTRTRHLPDRTRKVLLPKAYLRLVLTGEAVEEMSDASGTLWLDTGRPRLVRPDTGRDGTGAQPHAHPCRRLAGRRPHAPRTQPRELGFDAPPLFRWRRGRQCRRSGRTGRGRAPADSFLSLGTSGVLWRTTAELRAAAPVAPCTPSATPCPTAGTRCRFTFRPQRA